MVAKGYSLRHDYRRAILGGSQGLVVKDRVRFIHGHSAWTPGQLQRELDDNMVSRQCTRTVLDMCYEMLKIMHVHCTLHCMCYRMLKTMRADCGFQ